MSNVRFLCLSSVVQINDRNLSAAVSITFQSANLLHCKSQQRGFEDRIADCQISANDGLTVMHVNFQYAMLLSKTRIGYFVEVIVPKCWCSRDFKMLLQEVDIVLGVGWGKCRSLEVKRDFPTRTPHHIQNCPFSDSFVRNIRLLSPTVNTRHRHIGSRHSPDIGTHFRRIEFFPAKSL